MEGKGRTKSGHRNITKSQSLFFSCFLSFLLFLQKVQGCFVCVKPIEITIKLHYLRTRKFTGAKSESAATLRMRGVVEMGMIGEPGTVASPCCSCTDSSYCNASAKA